MSATGTPTAPAGWYDDPTGHGRFRYWDGISWTEHTSPGHAPAASTPPLGAGFPRLARWLGRLLRVLAVVEVFTLVVEGWGWLTMTQFEQDPYGTGVGPLEVYDTLSRVAGIGWVLLLLPTMVVWCVWQYRLARSAPARLRRSPGMHAGSWFIPVVALWFPLQNIRDLWDAYAPSSERADRPRTISVWWAFWIASNLLGSLSFRLDAKTLGDYRGLAELGVLESACGLAAALLAARVVARLSRRAREHGASA